MNEFDLKASQWDAKLVRVERAQAMREGIRAALPLSANMTALEYGCGTGLVSFALQRYLGYITLADSATSGMLIVLRDKIAASQVDDAAAVGLDDRSAADRTLSVMYALLTLRRIPDTDRILRAFYALLATPYLCVADLDTEDGTFHEG